MGQPYRFWTSNKMFQRKSYHENVLKLAPKPEDKPPRMVTMQAFGANPTKSDIPCSLNCLQAFRHGTRGATNIFTDGPESHSSEVIWSWCADHDWMFLANDMLKQVFINAHISGELYPGSTKHCYDPLYYYEKWYTVEELLLCEKCPHRFLGENDRREHIFMEHGHIER